MHSITQVYVHTYNNKNNKISLIRIYIYIYTYINYLLYYNIIFINICILYVKYYENDFVFFKLIQRSI